MQSSINEFAASLYKVNETLSLKTSKLMIFSIYIKQTASLKNKNFVLSPVCIQSILSLFYCDSTGKIAEMLQNSLQLESNITTETLKNEFHSFLKNFQGNSLVNIANGIYANENYFVMPSFEKLAAKKFYTTVRNMNFYNEIASVNKINAIVSLKTNGSITNIISAKDLNEKSSIIVTSAVYFNGPWLYEFENLNPQSLSIFFPFGCTFSSPSDIHQLNMMHITVCS